jgi:ABC-type amino acid transport substrate-binding protein
MTNGATAVVTVVPGQLTICTYGGFAPVCYKNPAGQLIGLDVSFLTRFAESLGLAIQTIEKPFDGIWTLPGVNACDVAGAGIMRRDDRPVGSGRLLERRILSGRTIAAGPGRRTSGVR